MTAQPLPTASSGAGRARLAPAIVAGLLLLTVVPLILSGRQASRAAYDQDRYSLPTIRQFADQLPRPNLADYGFASTPGYHLAMAVVDRLCGGRLRVLRLVSLLFALGLVALLAARLQQLTGAASAVALALPLAASSYVVASAGWLLPDDAAWLMLLWVLLLACRQNLDVRTLWLAAVSLALLVFVRQIHLWAAAVLWMGACTLPAASPSTRIQRTGMMLLATLPGFAVAAGFIFLWRGAVPPQFQAQHAHLNPAVPAAILALAAFFGGVMLCCVPGVLARLRTGVPILLGGAALGFFIGVIPHTSYDYDAGRFSGIWNIAAHLPAIAHRSLLIVGMSTLGGAVLGAWCALVDRRSMLLLLTAWAGFTAANTLNAQAWQRYYEPFELMIFALLAATVVRGRLPLCGFAVLALLTLAQVGVTVMSLR